MFRSILVPVDLSDKHSWRKALPVAISLCETFQAQLHVLTVVPDFGQVPGLNPGMVGQVLPEGSEASVRQQVARQLKDFTAEQVPDAIRCKRIIAEGKIYQEILRAADVVKADLIVMGSHRPELKELLLGPNPTMVVQHSGCSVMVVRE
jgi:nucleotide-binding universal stress UspA family protein